MAEKNFAITPSVSISRSKFLRTSNTKTSFNLGDIVPVYLDEVLPGDTRSIDLGALVRMSTPIYPIMDDIELEFFAFFVPNRLVWSQWKYFMGEQTSAGFAPFSGEFPYQEIGNNDGMEIKAGCLGDYFGLPLSDEQNFAPTTDIKVSALPLRGYILIYNRWFRDQNVEAPVYCDTSNGEDDSGLTYEQNCLVAYKKSDYFTRALPYAQKGAPVSLPLGTSAPVNLVTSDAVAASLYNIGGLGNTKKIQSDFIPYAQSDGTALSTSGSLVADLSSATAATINELREAFQLQKLLERDAMYGTRYWEILYGHFSVRSPDATLQDPEYLGGYRMDINIDQVLQTTGFNSTPASTQLGTPGANSVTGGKGSLFTKSFVEHGFIHIYMVARQKKHTYSQGLNRMWSRFDRYDYYWPEFANLGAMEIKKKELMAGQGASDEQVFGYQEAWADYRYKPSIATGRLRPTAMNALDFWTLTDIYSSVPTLGTTFLKETRANLNRALVTGDSGPDFIADIYWQDTAVRPMPLYSIPGLIDHH